MSEVSRAFRRLAELSKAVASVTTVGEVMFPKLSDCCNQLAIELEWEELNRTFPVITPVDLRALVQNVIDQQRQGFDALASAAWDRVVEYMEATDAKKTDA